MTSRAWITDSIMFHRADEQFDADGAFAECECPECGETFFVDGLPEDGERCEGCRKCACDNCGCTEFSGGECVRCSWRIGPLAEVRE